jgi:hypothetical protein
MLQTQINLFPHSCHFEPSGIARFTGNSAEVEKPAFLTFSSRWTRAMGFDNSLRLNILPANLYFAEICEEFISESECKFPGMNSLREVGSKKIGGSIG